MNHSLYTKRLLSLSVPKSQTPKASLKFHSGRKQGTCLLHHCRCDTLPNAASLNHFPSRYLPPSSLSPFFPFVLKAFCQMSCDAISVALSFPLPKALSEFKVLLQGGIEFRIALLTIVWLKCSPLPWQPHLTADVTDFAMDAKDVGNVFHIFAVLLISTTMISYKRFLEHRRKRNENYVLKLDKSFFRPFHCFTCFIAKTFVGLLHVFAC